MVILTHAGGPGVLAADALSQAGGELVVLPEKVLKELDPAMPKHWSMVNFYFLLFLLYFWFFK